MKRVEGNAWDGFDRGEYIYEDKSEKKYQSSIWKILAVISAISLIVLAADHIRALQVIRNGNSITAEYYEESNGRQKAVYYDEDGNMYMYNFENAYAVHDKDSIVLYYENDIRKVTPKMVWWTWAGRYALFGILFAISFWRIMKIYRK